MRAVRGFTDAATSTSHRREAEHPCPVRTRDITEVLASFGGVATRPQLIAEGFSPYGLTRAVREGHIQRLRRSRYALNDLDPGLKIAIQHGGVLGSVSAARAYGLWAGIDQRIHISWRNHGNVAKPGRVMFGTRPDLVHHWHVASCEPPETSVLMVTALEALAQILRTESKEMAVACADSAVRHGVLTDKEVRALLRSMPRRIAEWERYIDGRSDSGLESIVRIWLMDRGIPFIFHAVIPGVGEVDFLLGTSLILETDGGQFHDGPRDAERDARRNARSAARGFITLRARYRMVMFEPHEWQRPLIEHLSRGDHRRRIR
jgi:very-short-patch-repair endonuclease